jgi:competence protein ComEC
LKASSYLHRRFVDVILFSLGFVLGVCWLQQQAVLPDFSFALSLLSLPLLAYLFRQRAPVLKSLFLLFFSAGIGFFYAAWFAQQRLDFELPAVWQGRDISLIGVVAEMPKQHERGLSFRFDVESVNTTQASVPPHILLSTYQNAKNPKLDFHAGERWQLTVRLKQPHGTSNPYTFDFEAWALEQNIRAVGYVSGKGDNWILNNSIKSIGYAIERLREAVRAHFQRVLKDQPYVGVLSALSIGDQNSIPAAQWQVFTRTGVNHLMSISGLHITLLAGFAFTLVYAGWRRSTRLTLWLPARKAAVLAGFLVALSYALLAGYGVPAQRTIYMLGTVALALWSSRNIAPSQLLAFALLVVTLLDPWAVLSPGFWLSFGAVALIFYISANRLRAGHWLLEYARVQWAMSIGLIPLLLALFQQLSLVSPLANAFSIPLVSFVVVPLSLLGAVLPIDGLLQLAHFAMSHCYNLLNILNSFPLVVWTQHAPPLWTVLLGAFGIVWILLPRGFPARWLGGLMLLPIFFMPPELPAFGSLRMTIFDVGQGLAVGLQTREHALLVDSGIDFSADADSGSRILVPALRGLGVTQLDGLLLTHNDRDHTGGAASVLQAISTQWLLSSLPDEQPLLKLLPDSRRCVDGQNWQWDGVSFEILHPEPAAYTRTKVHTNELVCVLRIQVGENVILLAGDIEKGSERRLLQTHADKLAATVLIVPHHGSKTSSTVEFVQAVQPRYAVFSVGYRNQFHHPNAEVFARYADSIRLRTDEDGAILLQLDGKAIHVERYRQTHAKYWQTAALD